MTDIVQPHHLTCGIEEYNKRTSGPVNARLTPGIYLNATSCVHNQGRDRQRRVYTFLMSAEIPFHINHSLQIENKSLSFQIQKHMRDQIYLVNVNLGSQFGCHLDHVT